jgi:hypothetical protein
MAPALPFSTHLAATLLLLRLGSPSASSSEELTLAGTVAVRAVDDRRILVAVDTADRDHRPDGQVDHIFLFTASKSIDFATHEGYGSARLKFTGSTLTVAWQGAAVGRRRLVRGERTPAGSAGRR